MLVLHVLLVYCLFLSCFFIDSFFLFFFISFFFFFFFFSSRRRHTRLVSDWSSDVCSSDLMSKPTVLSNPSSSFRHSLYRSSEYLTVWSSILLIATTKLFTPRVLARDRKSVV